MWIADISSFVRPDGNLPDGRAGRAARFLGEIVRAASILPLDEAQQSAIRCRRRPNRRRCTGMLRLHRHRRGDEIHWCCTVCDDGGVITHWQRTCWDLSGEVQQGRIVSLCAERSRRAGRAPLALKKVSVYELDVELVGAPWPIPERVVRRIRLGGHCTLQDLHGAIFEAFDREEQAPYEFMFGAPYDPDVRRYTGPAATSAEESPWESQLVNLDGLTLRPGLAFGYLFDVHEVRVHRLTVISAREVVGRAVAPRVIERQGISPPERQLLSDEWDLLWSDLDSGPMSCLYGVYDAEAGPPANEWLALGSMERQVLIMEAHLSPPAEHPPVASMPLHAVVHELAETHLAELGEAALSLVESHPARRTGRHAVIHDIGAQLVSDQLRTCTPRETLSPARPLLPRRERDLGQ
jgi:hypothetical protein